MKIFYSLFAAVLTAFCLGCSCKTEVSDKDLSKDVPVEERAKYQEVFDKAAQGDVNEQSYLGVLYYTGSIGRNYDAAMGWFKKASENGSGEADYYISEMYEKGIHVEQSADTALKHLISAANKGFTTARIRLAEIYSEGEKESPFTKEEMTAWLNQYVQEGNERAKAALAKLSKADIKVKADVAAEAQEAAAEAAKAAAQPEQNEQAAPAQAK